MQRRDTKDKAASGSKRVRAGQEELIVALQTVGLSIYDLRLACHRLAESQFTLFSGESQLALKLLKSLESLVQEE